MNITTRYAVIAFVTTLPLAGLHTAEVLPSPEARDPAHCLRRSASNEVAGRGAARLSPSEIVIERESISPEDAGQTDSARWRWMSTRHGFMSMFPSWTARKTPTGQPQGENRHAEVEPSFLFPAIAGSRIKEGRD